MKNMLLKYLAVNLICVAFSDLEFDTYMDRKMSRKLYIQSYGYKSIRNTGHHYGCCGERYKNECQPCRYEILLQISLIFFEHLIPLDKYTKPSKEIRATKKYKRISFFARIWLKIIIQSFKRIYFTVTVFNTTRTISKI
ncbi:hypothetical protein HZS_2795 [Henneguya salminicola]|nr:hypothetical protein HZS_2795 [Henneguya salminicola]